MSVELTAALGLVIEAAESGNAKAILWMVDRELIRLRKIEFLAVKQGRLLLEEGVTSDDDAREIMRLAGGLLDSGG